ncbi:S-adenosyl-L-methionine-dependent methyltransferase [Rhypophila decipiens]|uniref:S-adenosyl-L-methionine-dependent methyltransferase n=1 Tax=Rhypophila decipiens TaxID=261697 RepID=A0AAN7B4W8_9PEZI|nr:S-adenosyl-L-methionine-dependent methyltransferase [Rhypophila decipiens]
MPAPLDAEAIARPSLHESGHFNIQHAQTAHRIALLSHWNIAPGSKVLELGCGQGDATTVLASAVGEQGSVVAVDPADLDYEGPLGRRISWARKSPIDYLSSRPSGTPFEAAVLAHSLWYFSSPALVLETFRAIKQNSKKLLLAEWSLSSTHPSSQPHVLAALTQAALECRKTDSKSNVRTVLSPKRLTELAVEAGWTLESEKRVQPEKGLLDGQWEVAAVFSKKFEEAVKENVKDERERGVVLALRDALEASLEGIQGGAKGVRSMDVWVAVFV